MGKCALATGVSGRSKARAAWTYPCRQRWLLPWLLILWFFGMIHGTQSMGHKVRDQYGTSMGCNANCTSQSTPIFPVAHRVAHSAQRGTERTARGEPGVPFQIQQCTLHIPIITRFVLIAHSTAHSTKRSNSAAHPYHHSFCSSSAQSGTERKARGERGGPYPCSTSVTSAAVNAPVARAASLSA